MEPDDVSEEFFAIANNIAAEQANAYLDKKLQEVEVWVKQREAQSQPADLRSLVTYLLHAPVERVPALVALGTALWRLRERESANEDRS